MKERFRKGLVSIVLAGASLLPVNAEEAETIPENNMKKLGSREYELSDYVNAVIEIESNGNPDAERYESHLNDTSYGLGQILTGTAKDLEKRHPDLPRLGKNPAKSLKNPEINRAYTETLFREEFNFYKDPYLAVAAYNSGHLTPRNARIQEMFNELYGTQLVTDGRLGKKSKEVIKRFQKDHDLSVDGIIGLITYARLQEVYAGKFPDKPNPAGIIPENKYTPNHVEKFRKALKSE